MTNGKKILLIAGVVTVGIGSFALTMYITNAYEKKMSKIYRKNLQKTVEDYDVFNNPVIE
jgi:hypothetical protein